MKNAKVFEIAAPMFIRATAEDAGLKVVFAGDQPGYARDEHTIYLPPYYTFEPSRLAADKDAKELFDVVTEIFLAAGLHEINHPAWSHPMWQRWPRFQTIGALGQALIQILEDIRVDTWRIRSSRGALRIYNDGYGRLIRMKYWVCQENDPAAVFRTWVLSRARVSVCGLNCFGDLADQCDAALRRLTSGQFVDGAWDIVARIGLARPGIDGSEDVYKVVEELLQYLQDQQQQQPQSSSGSDDSDASQEDSADPSNSGGSNGSDEADGDDASNEAGQSSASGQDDDDAGSPGQSASDSASPQQDDGAGSQPSSDSAGGQPQAATGNQQPNGNASNDDAAGAIESILDGDCPNAPKDVGSALAAALADASGTAAATGAFVYDPPSVGKARKGATLYMGDRDTKPLGIRLQRLLMSQAMTLSTWDRRGGRIDSRMLSRVPLGEREIFWDEQELPAVNTAVHVLVDRSPSMRGLRIRIARAAALRLCLALSHVEGSSVSAAAFPHHLQRSTDVLELLPTGGNPRQFAENFSSLATAAGGTPLAEGLVHAEYTLCRASQPRKLCVVLTDGEPDDARASMDVIARMTRAGIDVVGIGIETMCVSSLFPRFEIVQRVEDLEVALFRLLQSRLLRKAA